MLNLKPALCAAIAVAACAIAPAANAASYILNYTGSGAPASATLRVHVADTLNAVGGHDVLNITGFVGLDAVIGLIPNPNQPYNSISPDGLFIFDNVFFEGEPSVSNPGLLFRTATHEWNLFSNNTSQYQLYSATSSGYGIHSTGTLSANAVPEPRTWAMLIVGFGLTGAGLRQRRRSRLPA